jgi:cytochrome b involved in lipid metabolism
MMFQTACQLLSISLLLAGVAEAQYTSNDLAAHSTSNDCWTVVDGGVYGMFPT